MERIRAGWQKYYPEAIETETGIDYLSNSYRFGRKGLGTVLRWGERVTSEQRRDEIRQAFTGELNPRDQAAIYADYGVGEICVNRHPEPIAQAIATEVVCGAIQNTINSLDWKPQDIGGLFVGSSLMPLEGGETSEMYKQKLGLENARTFDAHAACASGGLAFIKSLADTDFYGERCIVVGVEDMLRRKAIYDPKDADPGSALLFTQAATVIGYTPGESIALRKGTFSYSEKPDRDGFLPAVTNYPTSPNFGYEITEIGNDRVIVRLPTPQDRNLIDMKAEVGVFFPDPAIATINQLRDEFDDDEWNRISAMVTHYPSKFIVQRLISGLARHEILPEGIINRYNPTPSEAKLFNEDPRTFMKNNWRAIRTNGIPDSLPIYPKDGLYGNAPAANTLIALVENADKLKRRDFIFLTFGAGAAFSAGVMGFS